MSTLEQETSRQYPESDQRPNQFNREPDRDPETIFLTDDEEDEGAVTEPYTVVPDEEPDEPEIENSQERTTPKAAPEASHPWVYDSTRKGAEVYAGRQSANPADKD